MRFRFIEDRCAEYPATIMCSVLDVSRAGYYAWRGRPQSRRSTESLALLDDIKQVHHDNHECYGSPRIHRELKAEGHGTSRGRVGPADDSQEPACPVTARRERLVSAQSPSTDPHAARPAVGQAARSLRLLRDHGELAAATQIRTPDHKDLAQVVGPTDALKTAPMGAVRGVPQAPSAPAASDYPSLCITLSEALSRRTGCGKSARPDL
jgi:hypothetical protein